MLRRLLLLLRRLLLVEFFNEILTIASPAPAPTPARAPARAPAQATAALLTGMNHSQAVIAQTHKPTNTRLAVSCNPPSLPSYPPNTYKCPTEQGKGNALLSVAVRGQVVRCLSPLLPPSEGEEGGIESGLTPTTPPTTVTVKGRLPGDVRFKIYCAS